MRAQDDAVGSVALHQDDDVKGGFIERSLYEICAASRAANRRSRRTIEGRFCRPLRKESEMNRGAAKETGRSCRHLIERKY